MKTKRSPLWKLLLYSIIVGCMLLPIVGAAQSIRSKDWYIVEWSNYGASVFTTQPVKYGKQNVAPFYFNIPVGTADGSTGVYNLYTLFGPVAIGQTLTFTFQTVSSGTPVYNANVQPDNQSTNCYAPSGYPAIVVPMLRRQQPSSDNRWFARDYRVALSPNATVTVTVPIDPAVWMDANGVWGNQTPAQFADDLANLYDVELDFGGGCYLSHGVNVQGGATRFILWQYQVN